MKSALLDLQLYNEKIDRRQRKTHVAVETALIELLETKPLDSISITELSEKADINRKTFYNNYESIEDVLKKLNGRIAKSLYDALPQKVTVNNEIEIYNLMLVFAKALEPHRTLLANIIQVQSDFTLMSQLSEILLPYIAQNFKSYNIDMTMVPYINSYIFNGITSLFYQWCKDDTLSIEQISLLCYNLTSSAMKLDNYKDIIKK